MAIKQIIETPNSILRNKNDKVTVFDENLKKEIDDLIDTVKDAKDPEGAGLAAPQIGINKKMCIVRNFFEDPQTGVVSAVDYVLINPKIVSKSKETSVDWEACLSVPDKFGQVERFEKIKVLAQNEHGNRIKIKAADYFARVIQHEMDHLEGVLFTDKVIGKTLSQKEFEEIQ